ncbi:senescence/dehydration-associated protein [Quercus suber]|uniref:Senescence/dehydration-associated protein n=2 Tax=Quercus suber TaxID=58331 RepID=A0AAW0KRN7_QUESU
MMPGEVLLASLDAVNKILDAAEVAEIQALSATSRATTRMVTKRFGESAGEATEDDFYFFYPSFQILVHNIYIHFDGNTFANAKVREIDLQGCQLWLH